MVPPGMNNQYSGREPHTLAVVSGKGGVGKTNTASNLAIQFASLGKRVLVFDADLGLSSVDVLLGLVPRYTIQQVLEGQCSCMDVLLEGPGGISILPACSGIPEMAELQPVKLKMLVNGLAEVAQRFDIVIIDAPSGIATNMQRVTEMADEILLLTTPEPTAAMDAYAVAKIFSTRRPQIPLRLMVNMISENDSGDRIVAGFHEVMARFLNRKVQILAKIPFDPHVPLAVRRQQAFTVCYPDCPAARSLRTAALRLLGQSVLGIPEAASADAPVRSGASGGAFINRISAWLDPQLG